MVNKRNIICGCQRSDESQKPNQLSKFRYTKDLNVDLVQCQPNKYISAKPDIQQALGKFISLFSMLVFLMCYFMYMEVPKPK